MGSSYDRPLAERPSITDRWTESGGKSVSGLVVVVGADVGVVELERR